MPAPIAWDETLEVEILRRLAEGESLRTICADASMPSMPTVMARIRASQAFAVAYAVATQARADAIFEQAIATAEVSPARDVMGKVDPGEVQHRRLLIDTLKWAAGKMYPKKYGDTTQVQGEVAHKHYVALIPARTTNDPAEWARQVHAERIALGEIPAGTPPPGTPDPQSTTEDSS